MKGRTLALVALVIAIPLAIFGAVILANLYFRPAVAVGAPPLVSVQRTSQVDGPGVTIATAPEGLKMTGSSVAQAAEANGTAVRGITVIGTGKVEVAPDVAFVNTSVMTRETTAKDAQDKNNITMAQVLKNLQSQGIVEKDIQTSGLSLSPVYARESVITGYSASNTLTIRVNDITKVGPVIDAAVSAGANAGLSVSFGLKDRTAPTAQALEAATKEARGRADAIAKGLGVTITGVALASEELISYPMGGMDSVAVRSAASADMAPTPIQPGELTVTARVRVAFTY